MMSNLWKNYKELIVIIAYIALIFCIYIFVISPLNSVILEKKQSAEKQSIDHDIDESKIKDIPLLKSKVDSVEQAQAKLDVFAELDNALPVMESIDSLASETLKIVKIESLNEGSELGADRQKNKGKNEDSIMEDLPGQDYILVRLTVTGDLNSVLGFVNKIENFKYFSEIISINLSKNEKVDEVKSVRNTQPTNFIQSLGQESQENASIETEPEMKGVFEVVFYL